MQVERFRPFFISGEVTNSAQFDFFSGVTVRRAVAMAGGYSEYADKRYAKITRLVNGQPIGGEVPLDFTIYPGDVIEIPQKKIAPNLSYNKHNRRLGMPADAQVTEVVQVEEHIVVDAQVQQGHYGAGSRRNGGFFGKFSKSTRRGAKNIATSPHLVAQYPQYSANAAPAATQAGQVVYDWSQGRVVNQHSPQHIPLTPTQSQMEMAQNVAGKYQAPHQQYYPQNGYANTPPTGDYSIQITDPANQSIVAPGSFDQAEDLRRTYSDPTSPYYPTN